MPEKQDGSKPLKSGRQELYCQGIVSGKSQQQAYIDAGYESKENSRQNAHRLSTNDYIQARIAHIQAETAIKAGITREGQAKKLEMVQAKCLANGEHATYVKAVEGESRLFGLDKQVIETTEQAPEMEESEAELMREFTAWRLQKARRGPQSDSVTVVDIRTPQERMDAQEATQ